MRQAIKLATMTVLLAGTGAFSVAAAPVGGSSPAPASLIEQAQFFFNDQQYCFYDDGWRGPGWYVCGSPWRRGYGWGGGREWGRRFHDEGRRDYREPPRERDNRDMDRRRDYDHRDRRGGEEHMRRGGGEGGMR